MRRIAARYIPNATILHAYPNQRLRVTTSWKSRMRETRQYGSVPAG